MNRPKCEDFIDEALEDAIDDMRSILNCRDPFEKLNESILAYDRDGEDMKLELSYGGPADGFIFKKDGSIVYYYQGWWDGAERELTGHNKKIMERIKDLLGLV